MKEQPEKKKRRESKGYRRLRRLILTVITLVVLGLAGFQIAYLIMPDNAILAVPGGAISKVVTPVQNVFANGVNWFTDYLYKLKLRSRIEKEYNKLRQENEELVYRAMLADELAKKLSVYENLYDEISVNESMNPLVATVIGRDQGNYFSVFTINKGSRDGINDFMAVTMDGALVGYTYNVTETKSDVRTIIDSEASIAGLISTSRNQGTVRGTLGIDGQAMCRMYYLPEDHLPRPGDIVVTSGVGMSFPKGIPIGIVRESTRGMESNKQFIVLEPEADFQHIEYVVVLRYQPTAGKVEERDDGGELILSPLETERPIPTIQIGTEFFQLAPTPEPTPIPTPVPEGYVPEPGETTTPAPLTNEDSSFEYVAPGATVGLGYGFTLAPTASPTPTPPPLVLSVEED